MKYRTQSAEVLNEADALERKLDYMLFVQEQNARLWSDPSDWVPGDPIAETEWGLNHYHEMIGRIQHFVWRESGPLGNVMRPMFQLFEDDDTMESREEVRCEDCDVWFGFPENTCFVCGREVDPLPDPASFQKSLLYGYGVLNVGRIERVVETDGALFASGRLDDITMIEDYDIDFNQVRFTAEAYAPDGAVVRARQTMDRDDLMDVHVSLDMSSWLRQEMRAMLEVEMSRHMHGWFFGSGFIEYPTVSVQAEETVECDEVDFTFSAESLYASGPTTTPPFVLPSDIDLSVRPREIEPPVIDVRSGEVVSTAERYYMNTPITEQRRTRT